MPWRGYLPFVCIASIVFSILLLMTPGFALAQEPSAIAVKVNGAQAPAATSPRGAIRDAPLAPVEKDGHLLIPARFLQYVLRENVWWDSRWKILEINGGVRFRLGTKEAHWPQPVVGGNVTGIQPLSVAPQIMHGRVYVPMEETLQMLQHRYKWDPKARVLHVYPREKGQ